MTASNFKIDSNDIARKLLELGNKTGYQILQQHGQRIYGGPPPDWTGPAPDRGTEVYCYRIPRDCFEDELVPVFQSVGKLYELRLMIEFSGANRSYCYVRYCNSEDARKAILMLNNYPIRHGYPLAVTRSVDNRKLCIKTVPPLGSNVAEKTVVEELAKFVDGVSGAKFIARRWLQIEFDSHRMAALARRQLVPGNQTMFGQVLIKQVDWADPEENLSTGIDNKVVSVRGIVANVSEAEIKHWFNILTEGQVDNVVRSNEEILITFLTPEAANHVMAIGPNLEAGKEKLHLSWWLPRGQQRPHAEFDSTNVSSEMDLTKLVSSPPPTAITGPLERMHDLCLRQNWGLPQYNCSTFLDKTGQHVYQYEVSVPAVSKNCVLGEPSHDRHMALINSACAALQGIARASVQQYAAQVQPPIHSHYRTPPVPAVSMPTFPPPAPVLPMTLLQPPPPPRIRSNIQTAARPTREQTNLLDDNANITPATKKPSFDANLLPKMKRVQETSSLQNLLPY